MPYIRRSVGGELNAQLSRNYKAFLGHFDVDLELDPNPKMKILFNKKPQLSLRNPRDVMLPAVACTVCEIFASNYRVTLKLGLRSLKVVESATIR